MTRFQQDGIRAGEAYVKQITDEIYELRPGNNRVLFFGWCGHQFVLLSHFRKKTQRTPPPEIAKAIRLMTDWKERKGKDGSNHDNME